MPALWRLEFIGALLLLATVGGPAQPAADSPLDIGSRLQLFTDRRLVDSLHGAELRLHHPVPQEVVFRFDPPWEGPESGYLTVMRDGSRYPCTTAAAAT